MEKITIEVKNKMAQDFIENFKTQTEFSDEEFSEVCVKAIVSYISTMIITKDFAARSQLLSTGIGELANNIYSLQNLDYAIISLISEIGENKDTPHNSVSCLFPEEFKPKDKIKTIMASLEILVDYMKKCAKQDPSCEETVEVFLNNIKDKEIKVIDLAEDINNLN